MKFLSLHTRPLIHNPDNFGADTPSIDLEDITSVRNSIGIFCSTLETHTLGEAYSFVNNTSLRAIKVSARITEGIVLGSKAESGSLTRRLLEISREIRRVMGSGFSGPTLKRFSTPANRFDVVVNGLCQLGAKL